jgi:hypothetical protein
MSPFEFLKPDLVGKKFKEAHFQITHEWIRSYKEALGYSKKECENLNFVPSSFAACMRDSEYSAFEELGLELSQLLHGSQTYRFFEKIQGGDEIQSQTEIQRLLRKKSKTGDLVFIEFRNLFRRIKRAGVLESEPRGVPVVESTVNVVVRELQKNPVENLSL